MEIEVLRIQLNARRESWPAFETTPSMCNYLAENTRDKWNFMVTFIDDDEWPTWISWMEQKAGIPTIPLKNEYVRVLPSKVPKQIFIVGQYQLPYVLQEGLVPNESQSFNLTNNNQQLSYQQTRARMVQYQIDKFTISRN